MINGLWTVEFSSALGETSGGVLIFRQGRAFGGNSSYYYDGGYVTEDEIISVKVSAMTYSPATVSLFGHLRNFTLILNGKIRYPSMELTGRLSTNPKIKIFANCTKQFPL